MKSRVRRMSISRLAQLVVVLLVMGSSPALAGDEQHCVVDVVGEGLNGELRLSTPRCYQRFADALADASDGTVQLAPDVGIDVVFIDAGVAARVSSFVLGIHYDGYGGSGSSISVVGSSCTGGWWNTGSTWANRISSSYNGCNRLVHYDLANKGGISEGTYGVGTTDNLGLLNNRAESVSYNG